MIYHSTALDSPTVSSKKADRDRIAAAMAEYEAKNKVTTVPLQNVDLSWPLRHHHFSSHIDALREKE